MKIKWNTWKRVGRGALLGTALAAICLMGAAKYRQQELVEHLSDKIIRFHVLANSDSERDQELKLLVRDAVGAMMQQRLAGVTDKEESRQVILESVDEIQRTAQEALQQQGCEYPVTAGLCQVEFPEKTYGSFCFPAGEYEALQLRIGQGKGQNWWCVMYPNMCFFNSIYKVVDEEAERSLEQVLTKEEYQAVMEEGNYKVKFKWLSFLNQ
ncbi:MAG: stage II sporulation protein R [Lachnospiraceae bacterium]|nr:stage II sporulation protein R [Lachnospiraceae bacterium]